MAFEVSADEPAIQAVPLLEERGLRIIERITCRRGASLYKAAGQGETFAVKIAMDLAVGRGAYNPAAVLRHEAAVLRRIQHLTGDYLVDCGTHADFCWLQVRWRSGRPASELLEASRNSPGEFQSLAITLVRRFFEAVARLHSAGFVHGDLQPAHLLVDDHLTVQLIDFGLARHVETDLNFPYEGGPAPFLPPEVAQKRLEKRTALVLDTLAEVYAAGATAFSLYTGQAPLDLDALEPCSPEDTFHAIASTPGRSFQDVGAPPCPRLESVLQSCLALHRADRCPSLQAALERLQG
jgi:serine/threonine protein kinase